MRRIPVACLALLFAVVPLRGADVSFSQTYVDLNYGGNGRPGWARAGDMDGDGDLDIVAGGGEALFIYENDGTGGGWTRYGNLDGSGQIGGNGGVLHDVDGDGDLDVICAHYTNDLRWWENPGGALASSAWTFHKISDETRYLHDVMVADLDGDGVAGEFIFNMNAGYWNAKITIKWMRPGPDPTQPWEQHTIEADRTEGAPHGHSGVDVADIDGDGNVDLAYANGWYEAPDNPIGSWTWHQITTEYGVSTTLIRDINADGDLDLVMSAGHHGTGVYWFEAPPNPITGTWTKRTIDSTIGNPECLQVVDLWGDGDWDVVTCDLDFDNWDQEVHNVYVFQNLGLGASWSKQTIHPNSYSSHLLQIVDINEDGLDDIISEATGYSVVSYYENTSGFPSCADDGFEDNDACATPSSLPEDTQQAHKHCDKDWFELDVIAGATYEVTTSSLAGGDDTYLAAFGPSCGNFLGADDDSGPGSSSLLTWTSGYAGTALVSSSALGGYDEQYGYSIAYDCILNCGLCTGPDHLTLDDDEVMGTMTKTACLTIDVGPDYTVTSTGDLTLRAGDEIGLGNGTSVAPGGKLTLEIDRSLR